MKKLAFFVEGQTERIFLEEALCAYLKDPLINRVGHEFKGQNLSIIKGSERGPYPDAKYEIIIFDCGNDERALSTLIDSAPGMLKEGNKYLLAMRDLYPHKIDEKEEIEKEIQKILVDKSLSNVARIIIAVMELEAWFFADNELFSKIYGITDEKIQEVTLLDMKNIHPEEIPHPSAAIKKIFGIVNEKYGKHERDAYKIVSNLNFDLLLRNEEILKKTPSLKKFVDCLNEVTSP